MHHYPWLARCTLQNDLTIILGQITKWFQENSLCLNLCKTHLIQFSSKNQNYLDIAIAHRNGFIPKINEIKFLGLHINNTLSWTTHIDNILRKLSSACYAMKSVKSYVSQQMLKVIYYSYFHSIMSYGIIFWGHCGWYECLQITKKDNKDHNRM
jgi:hypothetical protein